MYPKKGRVANGKDRGECNSAHKSYWGPPGAGRRRSDNNTMGTVCRARGGSERGREGRTGERPVPGAGPGAE